MFAVIADTTANVSHVNQLSVLARYVDQDIQLSVVARYVDQEGYAQEHLVDIQGIDDKMVEGHAQGIQHRLPVQRLFYEGHLGREVPYFPCLAHCVNTTLERSCQAITTTCYMFGILQEVFVSFMICCLHPTCIILHNSKLFKQNSLLLRGRLVNSNWSFSVT